MKYFLARSWFYILIVFFVMVSLSSAEFPEKPITILVHSKPGSAIDITSRQIANIAHKYCPVPILVENKSGGSGVIAMRTALNRKADGYTILGVTKSFISTILLTQSGITMDNFYFLACMVEDPEALITNRHSSVRTLEDIISDAKSRGGKQRWLGPLVGGVDHLMALRTWDILGIKAEWIPYEGGSDALAALMGKHGVVYVGNPGDILGRPDLMVAAVASPHRLSRFPQAPTFIEKGYELTNEVLWRGYAVRKGTNIKAVNYLTDLFRKVSTDTAWLNFVYTTAARPVFYDHREFTRVVNRDQKIAIKYLQKSGILKTNRGDDIANYTMSALLLSIIYLLILFFTYFFKRHWLSGDTVLASLFIFIGIFLYLQTFNFPVGKLTSSVGPASIPHLWIYALWFFNLWLLISTIKYPVRQKNTNFGKIIVPLRLMILMIVYVVVVQYLGYYLSTLIFLVIGAYLLGYRNHFPIFGVSLAYIIFAYFVFYKMLQVPLPELIWFH